MLENDPKKAKDASKKLPTLERKTIIALQNFSNECVKEGKEKDWFSFIGEKFKAINNGKDVSSSTLYRWERQAREYNYIKED